MSGAVTAVIAAVIGFSTVTDRFDLAFVLASSAKWTLKSSSARIAVDSELPTLSVVSGDDEDACCFCSPAELSVLLICFDTCWITVADGFSLYPVDWWFVRLATVLLSMSCCVWNVFFLAELFLTAWFESELSDLQYSCWSPVNSNKCQKFSVFCVAEFA